MVNHESGCCSGYFFDAGFLEETVGQVGAAFCLYDDMGAWDAFGVEPPVIACGQLEGELLVLVVVLSHIDVETVGGNVVEGLAGDFRLLVA